MEDLRKMFEPVTANSEAVKRIRELDSVPWAIKYIGRRLNSECKTHFNLKDDQGFKIELPWEGQERHVEHNYYDDSTYIHELVVDVHAEGPAKGRIKSVHAYHWDHWHTTSNWQDHSESHSSEVRPSNEQEIQQYQRLLDQWTEGGSDEQIEALESCLERIALSQNGMVRVQFDHHLTVSFNDGSGASQDENPSVSIDWLKEALDLSHVRIEALFSKLFRKKRAGLKTDDGRFLGDEGIWLQYFLNLFDFSSSPELYPYLEGAKKEWLFDLFVESENYRNFMNLDSSVWWRDAWWRLQEILSIESRQAENNQLLLSYSHFLHGIRGKNLIPSGNAFEDPLKEFVGKVRLSSTKEAGNLSAFIPDEGLDLTDYSNGERKRPKFYTKVLNGVKWAYCVQDFFSYSDDHKYAVIDLNQSDLIEGQCDGEVIVPGHIDRYCVEQIRALGAERPKSWRSLVVDDICGDYMSIGPKGWTLRARRGTRPLSIGPGTFKGWTQLEKVVFKKTVGIASSAFEGCCKLSEVSFEDGVTSIGEMAFFGCANLESFAVKCEENAFTIERSAFEKCAGLESVALSYCGKITIMNNAFRGCTALNRVELKDISPNKAKDEQEVSILKAKCFYGCESLKSVLLPAMVKIVEREAFSGKYGHIRIHHDGDVFWFEGFGALRWCKVYHWNWGRIVRYDDNEEMPLSSLLEKLDIPRAKYIELALKHGDSFKKIIEIILRKRSLQSSDRASYDS